MSAERFVVWPLLSQPKKREVPQPVGKPGDPNYLQIGEWWNRLPPGHCCSRGFVSDSRFAGDQSITQVIKRTNRNVTRKWRKLEQ